MASRFQLVGNAYFNLDHARCVIWGGVSCTIVWSNGDEEQLEHKEMEEIIKQRGALIEQEEKRHQELILALRGIATAAGTPRE